MRYMLLPEKKDGAESRLARPRAFQSVLDLCEREQACLLPVRMR